MSSSEPTPRDRPRILSGIQPSGRLHLGNYFGAIKQQVDLQDIGECYYFIANFHSLTTVRDAAALQEYSQDVAVTYLACGLDPERTVFYRQSDVPEVTEITWLLATVTGMGLLERAHSYKEKISKGITPNAGLFLYPALMAADILAPQSDLVPVGSDQDQHVEMTRDMAQLFNNTYCPDDPVFRLPKSKMSETPKVTGTTFEKGTVLQVSTELGARRPDDDRPVDITAYVSRFRAFVSQLLEQRAPEELQTTEDLAAAISAVHDEKIGGVEVHERILRVTSEASSEPHVIAREDRIGVEFCVELDHVVFLTQDGRRVAAKMSKSYGNTIEIFAEGKPLKKTVMGIETRPKALKEPLDPVEDLVIQLFRLFATGPEVADMEERYRAGGFGFGNAKKALLAKINEYFAPIRERRHALEKDRGYVEDVLRTGGRAARAVARDTLYRARDACGIGPLVT